MNKLKSFISYIQDGSLKDRVRARAVYSILPNTATANRVLEDYTYRDVKRKYSDALDYSVQRTKEQNLKQEYSNIIWIFWRQGYDAAPDLVKACYASVKRELGDRDIVFLSDDNLNQYIDLPPGIKQKKEDGIISEAHYSDIVRIALLAEYGGLWLDATVYCTGCSLAEKMKNMPLFVYKNISLDRTEETSVICSSWLISAYRNNPLILSIRDMMYTYWEREKHLMNYFVFHIFIHMVKDKFVKQWEAIPLFNNVSPHILQFELLNKYDPDRYQEIKDLSDFHKLNHHIAQDAGADEVKDSFMEHIIETERR